MLSKDLTARSRERAIKHTAEINGVNSVYFEYPSQKLNAETIVMIHGYRGNHRGLEAIAAGLRDFRVFIPDLPGFGLSAELSGRHDLEGYAKWLGEFLSELELAKTVHLVGHSFGTLVVGKYASTHSAKSVSLINPVSAPALSGPRAYLTKVTSALYHVSNALPERVGGFLLRSPVAVMFMSAVMAKTKNKQLRSWIHQQHLENFSDFSSVKVATQGYDASVSSNLSEMAAGIQAPVLIVAAELDDITAIAVQKDAVKLYPRAILKEIPGVGHLVHYEAPELAAKHISKFIESVS